MQARKLLVGIGVVTAVMLAPSAAWAYEAEAGNANCSQIHGTVVTRGHSNPGSVQRHTHDGVVKNFGVVYGYWYSKYYYGGQVSAAYYIEARDYDVTGYLDNAKTYGYCID